MDVEIGVQISGVEIIISGDEFNIDYFCFDGSYGIGIVIFGIVEVIVFKLGY